MNLTNITTVLFTLAAATPSFAADKETQTATITSSQTSAFRLTDEDKVLAGIFTERVETIGGPRKYGYVKPLPANCPLLNPEARFTRQEIEGILALSRSEQTQFDPVFARYATCLPGIDWSIFSALQSISLLDDGAVISKEVSRLGSVRIGAEACVTLLDTYGLGNVCRDMNDPQTHILAATARLEQVIGAIREHCRPDIPDKQLSYLIYIGYAYPHTDTFRHMLKERACRKAAPG